MEALAAEARESGESITDGNLRFTLEYYWYDRENAEGFYAIRIDSLDGTPLDMEAVRKVLVAFNWNRQARQKRGMLIFPPWGLAGQGLQAQG